MWRVQYCMCVCLVLHVTSDWWYMCLFKVTRVFSATDAVWFVLYLCLFIGSCDVCAVLCMCLCLCGVWHGTCVSVECHMWSVLRVTHQVLSRIRLVLHGCVVLCVGLFVATCPVRVVSHVSLFSVSYVQSVTVRIDTNMQITQDKRGLSRVELSAHLQTLWSPGGWTTAGHGAHGARKLTQTKEFRTTTCMDYQLC